MTRRFEDVGELFSKLIEKCHLTQLRAVCYAYEGFIYSTFLSNGTSAGNTYIRITIKIYWVMIGLYKSENSF